MTATFLPRRRAAIAAVLIAALGPGSALGTTAAGAVTLRDLGGLAGFQALGGSERAVAEMRIGNNALNGDWEFGAAADTQVPAGQKQHVWGDAVFNRFRVAYDGSTFALTVGSQTASAALDLAGARSIVLRGVGNNGGKTTIRHLKVNGATVGTGLFEFGSPADFYQLGGFGLSAFEITGAIAFDFVDGLPRNNQGSNLAAQFKVTTAPIPLPAAGWLLIGGLAALGGLRRRRRP